MTGVSKEDVVEQFVDANYGTFKKAVGDVVVEKFEKIQARYNELINSDELDKILDEGMQKSREIAKEKYEMMKKKIGLRR